MKQTRHTHTKSVRQAGMEERERERERGGGQGEDRERERKKGSEGKRDRREATSQPEAVADPGRTSDKHPTPRHQDDSPHNLQRHPPDVLGGEAVQDRGTIVDCCWVGFILFFFGGGYWSMAGDDMHRALLTATPAGSAGTKKKRGTSDTSV